MISDSIEKSRRFLRTARTLRPEQALGRPIAVLTQPPMQMLLRIVGTAHPPEARSAWSEPSPEIRNHAATEAARATRRLARIRDDRALWEYEIAYGRGLLGPDGALPNVSRGARLDPFPASVRARSVALAIRLGARGLDAELALAARAVALQVEWRLLGNHLLENAIALACAATATMGGESALWWSLGRAILERELKEQFLGDGGHFERSATYHGWLVTALLELVELRNGAGLDVPESWRAVLRAALDWNQRVRGPDDTWPLLNDASLDACPSPDALARLAASHGLVAEPRVPGATDLLADTGWTILRTGSAMLVADVGPVGPDYQPGHAHADSLSFELWVQGARLAVDPGVAAYGQGVEREWTRSTAAHNTVALDEADSSEMWAGFRVGRRATTRVTNCEGGGASATLSAEHDGYRWLNGGPIHQRTWTLEPMALKIVDTIRGVGEHRATSHVRLDADAAERLGAQVVMNGQVTAPTRDRWYPNHAEPREALVARGERRGSLPLQLSTRIGWTRGATDRKPPPP